MPTTYEDLAVGDRHEVEVELVTRRPIEVAGERLHRLLVADHRGEQFSILIAPDADPLYDLKTGGCYRIRGLSVRESLAESSDAADELDSLLVRAARRLDVEGPFGVVDDRTTVSVGRDRPTEVCE